MRPAGVEPATFGFGGRRSIQLSYERESCFKYYHIPQQASKAWLSAGVSSLRYGLLNAGLQAPSLPLLEMPFSADGIGDKRAAPIS